MEVSLIVPCCNEIKTLPEVLDRLSSLSFAPESEVIAVDDGSCDGTFSFLNSARHNYPFRLVPVKHSQNFGKGAAISTGLDLASGKIVMIQDADLEYDTSALEELYHKLKNCGYDVALGSRIIEKNNRNYNWLYLAGNRFLTFVINLFFSGRLTDSYTCHKAFKASLAKTLALESEGFEAEAEICCKMLSRKYHYCEVPVRYQPRGRDEGKKINFKDAVKGFIKIIKLRLKSFRESI